jgi:hypothetical protein
MKLKAAAKIKTRAKERRRNLIADPTLEGKDENKVGRVQEKIGLVDKGALLNGILVMKLSEK